MCDLWCVCGCECHVCYVDGFMVRLLYASCGYGGLVKLSHIWNTWM